MNIVVADNINNLDDYGLIRSSTSPLPIDVYDSIFCNNGIPVYYHQRYVNVDTDTELASTCGAYQFLADYSAPETSPAVDGNVTTELPTVAALVAVMINPGQSSAALEAVVAGALATDILGVPRNIDANCDCTYESDLGAYEFVQTNLDGDANKYCGGNDAQCEDCNDNNAQMNTYATEVVGNQIDDNCNDISVDHAEYTPGGQKVTVTATYLGSEQGSLMVDFSALPNALAMDNPSGSLWEYSGKKITPCPEVVDVYMDVANPDSVAVQCPPPQ